MEEAAGAATPPDHGAGPPPGARERPVALAALAAGLAAAPLAAPAPAEPPLVIGGLILILVAAAGRRSTSRGRSAGTLGRLVAIGLAAAAFGTGIGCARVAAIDAGAFDAEPGVRVTATGHVADAPRGSSGRLRLRLATADGRLAVEAPAPGPGLRTGDAVRATGTIREPLPWERQRLRRQGVRAVLVTDRVVPLGGSRGGLAGRLDAIRARVDAALLGGGGPGSSILRGFVLGQDDRIPPQTLEAFRRSGLAHLLAVSGTNVMLLSLLAFAALGLIGVPLRARLLWIVALIAVYVPVAGASPSIQRAGVMGIAGVVAVLASRPRSRGYALLLAAVATLALNPRAAGEVSWQLSFAAVTGILIWTARISDLLQRPDRRRRSRARAALADGAGLTVAATVATAPLMAHHFGAFPVTSLPANLLALPAVAPAMWLGMAAGMLAQVPGAPAEAAAAAGAAFAAYIGQVATWMGSPGWALAEVELAGPLAVGSACALVAVVLVLVLAWWRRRRSQRPRTALAAVALAALALLAAPLAPAAIGELAGGGGAGYAVPADGLTVSFLDVGQGDAILLDPGDGDPVLVDAGPPGSGVAAELLGRGVERLGALVVTHPDDDHAGGVAEVLAAVPTSVLAQANPDPALSAVAAALGTRTIPIASGDRLRAGSLRLETIWPPARLLDGGWAAEEPNRLSVVLVARFAGTRILLTGDAEAEAVPLDPGPVDVLKVSHHGSDDAGLGALLARTRPRLGVISSGEDNSFGHPTPATLAALAEHGVATHRTDLAGELRVEVVPGGWRAAPAD